MTFSDLLKSAEARLAAAGVDSPALDVRWLAEHAFGLTRTELRSRGRDLPDPQRAAAFERLLARREKREPLQRLLGSWEFWGLELALGPDTLIPRADTETLVEAVLRRRPDRARPWRILDLGTGTGAILLALLHEYRSAFGIGVDFSPGAASVAALNARRLGLSDRAGFLVGSWADALGGGQFDILASNPPYIPDADIAGLEPEVALHEPRLALAGGADGLDPYRHLAREALRLLAPGGLIALEHGFDQGEAVRGLLSQAGLSGAETLADLGGRPRVTCATLP